MTEKLLLKELARYNIGTFADNIYRNALLYPDLEAFVYENSRITFSQYNSRVNQLIHALYKMGNKKGNMIGILSWNCQQMVELFGATMKGGFIASPFNPRLTADELDYLVNYSETDTIFVGPELVDTINNLRPRLKKVKNYIINEGKSPDFISYEDLISAHSKEEPDVFVEETDPCCVIYTSGTTGVPRGAVYVHSSFIDDARTFAINIAIQPGDRHLQVTPQFHIAGHTWYRTFFLTANCSVIHKFFDPVKMLQTIQDEKITHVNIVPTQLVAMLNVPDLASYDLSSIKFLWYGGSPMPLEVLKRGMNTFGVVFGEGFGQSESGPAISHMPKEDHDVLDRPPEQQKHLMSAGKPDIGVQVRVVDENNKDVKPGEVGEIIVKSKHIMTKYWHKPEETKKAVKDGWLHTGDMGTYDEQGYIYLTDRKKDMIITGGENVFPREVEEILYKHPAVSEAAVIGIPDPYWVEKVHAVIELRKDKSCTPEEIMKFCKQYLAGYKTPKSVEFIDALPKNAAGKILKKELRQKYWEGHQRTI
jgi:acyl-CoA synthetase (AMP-forming)/AMP-acid ligase II